MDLPVIIVVFDDHLQGISCGETRCVVSHPLSEEEEENKDEKNDEIDLETDLNHDWRTSSELYDVDKAMSFDKYIKQ